MAIVDPEDSVVVISIVYDGPPEAGKTTSVRALGRGFGRPVYTPEEQNGRTVYFDWMEYTGGLFEGLRIRCQIATVPGQRRWVHRRARFLDRADVVVFVGDTTAAAWPDSLDRLRDLRSRLDARGEASVGIVFQANKRDRADAVPIDVVRRSVGADRIGVVESVASEGQGIRETFVLAVRLALDRVREEQRLGRLPKGRPEVAHGEQLLDALKALETPSQDHAPVAPVRRHDAPQLPSADAPSGAIWPPVDGRVILHETQALGLHARITATGDCVAGLGQTWRVHSKADAVFVDSDEGRRALVSWARQHAAGHRVLSKSRCIVLGDTGDGRWRLWQVVRAEVSLRDLLIDAPRGASPQTLAQSIARTLRMLSDARALCSAAALPVVCTLDSIGVSELEQPAYIGLMPRVADQTLAAPDPDHTARELASLFDDRDASERRALGNALEAMSSTSASWSMDGAHTALRLASLLAQRGGIG